VTETHDWMLVAPWYRWLRQETELGLAPRATRPVIQKYEEPKFVDAFLADPQHSLVFNDDDWVYETSVFEAKRVASGPLTGKVAEPAVKRGPNRFERYLATKTSIRKLFLDTHKRFYVVVCELHCDVPGFPGAKRDDVCQAGFVVRRRYTTYPAEAESEATTILKEISALQLELAKLERTPSAKRALRRWEAFPPPNANGAVKIRKDGLRLALKQQRKRLRQWAAESGVVQAHLGWIGTERKGVGTWQVVEEEPQTLLEDVYPLYPLVPHPNDSSHSGNDSTIYFGVIPTASSDTDLLGVSRYDDHHLYEIRCFARRHKDTCPRTADPNDCNGELFWSEPTEVFRLATHFDPVGTSHRPVNVQLPDFPTLAAQVAGRPVGALSPVRMTQPPRSSLKFSPDVPPTSGSVGDGQICFLAIPLITIVAWFVLNLFLPIVTFVFGLWFLLKLKFCIPPSISVSAGVEAQLAVAAQFNLDVDVGVHAGFSATTLHTNLTTHIATATGGGATAEAELGEFSNKPLAELDAGLSKPQKGPDFTAGIVWEEPVARAEVVAV
jgi:hypothetical protein